MRVCGTLFEVAGHVLEWEMDFEVHAALVTRSVAPADFSKLVGVVLPVCTMETLSTTVDMDTM